MSTCCGKGQPEGERSGLEGSSCPQSPLRQHPSGHPAPHQQPGNPPPAVLQCPLPHCHALQLTENKGLRFSAIITGAARGSSPEALQ